MLGMDLNIHENTSFGRARSFSEAQHDSVRLANGAPALLLNHYASIR